MKSFLGAALFLMMGAGSLLAQTDNIGKPIPADSFGFTVFSNAPGFTPALPYSTSRSWDANRISWPFLNPSSGTYNWTGLDAWMSVNVGKDMIYTLGLAPHWAASGQTANAPYPTPNGTHASCSLPANISDWDAFITAIATHSAGRIKYWELWNEPMNYQYWCVGVQGAFNDRVTTVSATNKAAVFAYTGKLFAHARAIIKGIDPNAVVLGPSIDKQFGLDWMTNYFKNGGKVSWDVMAIHGYPEKAPNPPETMVSMVSSYAAYMANHGMTNMPIWDTEAAWSEVDGAWVAKMYILSWSSGVSRTIWYGYDHFPTALWNPATGLTDAGVGYSNVYQWLVGATMTSACTQDDSGTYSCPIAKKNYKGIILWNSKSTVRVPAPSGMKKYRDLQGALHEVTGKALSVGNSPVLLETSVREGRGGRSSK